MAEWDEGGSGDRRDHKQRVAGTDLCLGDIVRLKNMTVAGQVDDEIRCTWFQKSGDEFGDLCGSPFPRASLVLVEED